MPTRGGDGAVAALGIRRIPVTIPFPQAGGPVNVLAVEEEGGGFALLDAGLGTPEAEAELRAGLAAAGVRIPEIRRIFVTHGHIDHYGLAQTLREESRAEVFVHPADLSKIAASGNWREQRAGYDSFFLKVGVPREKLERMAELAGSTSAFARRVEPPFVALAEGQRFQFARCEATVLEMPGHTPGLCCFLLAPRGAAVGLAPAALIGGDHLLERTSPNPLLELLPDGSRFRALPAYFENARRARELALDWVIPGHGPCFPEHRRVIDDLFGFYARRQEKLRGKIPPDGATPVELVRSIFPEARTLDLFLMIGEVLGNLDLLEAAGRVRAVDDGATLRYKAT